MILNAFSVVAVFAAILRGGLGLIVLAAGARAMRSLVRSRVQEEGEERFYLLVGASATLVVLALVSWPLLYLVLQSYIPQWPGVMCVQGVTRVGSGSIGAASWLPRLLEVLAFTKPLLIFASGAWLVLHLVSRRERTAARAGGILAALVLCGLLAVADGAVETAYLVIPKQERFLAAGCCAGAVETARSPASSLPLLGAGGAHADATMIAFLAVGGGLVAALSAAIRRSGRWLALSIAGAALSLPLGLVFLGDVAAPRLLHTPYHHCIYCLAKWRPETLLGIGLYASGAFGVGWAFLARRAEKGGGAGEGVSLPLLRMARFGYLGSLLMAVVMMVSA